MISSIMSKSFDFDGQTSSNPVRPPIKNGMKGMAGVTYYDKVNNCYSWILFFFTSLSKHTGSIQCEVTKLAAAAWWALNIGLDFTYRISVGVKIGIVQVHSSLTYAVSDSTPNFKKIWAEFVGSLPLFDGFSSGLLVFFLLQTLTRYILWVGFPWLW